MKLTVEEVKTLRDIDNFATPSLRDSLRVQWNRGLHNPEPKQLEDIYKKYIDSKFVLSHHCGSCVHGMLIKVFALLDEYEAAEEAYPPLVELGKDDKGKTITEETKIK